MQKQKIHHSHIIMLEEGIFICWEDIVQFPVMIFDNFQNVECMQCYEKLGASWSPLGNRTLSNCCAIEKVKLELRRCSMDQWSQQWFSQQASGLWVACKIKFYLIYDPEKASKSIIISNNIWLKYLNWYHVL